MKIEILNPVKDALLSAALPQITNSYTPVAHAHLLDMIGEKLDRRNYKIEHEHFSSNEKNTQMFGVYRLTYGSDEHKLSIGFRNSYDKSLAVGMVAGSSVIVCSNLMFAGDIKVMRKHTSNIFNDLDNMIGETIDLAEHEYEVLEADTATMKSKPLSLTEMAEASGRMFIQHNLITPTQMNILRRELTDSEAFKEKTVWDFYNHTTEALKSSHPRDVMNRHTKVHKFMKSL